MRMCRRDMRRAQVLGYPLKRACETLKGNDIRSSWSGNAQTTRKALKMPDIRSSALSNAQVSKKALKRASQTLKRRPPSPNKNAFPACWEGVFHHYFWCFSTVSTKLLMSGCGRVGRDTNSGWNWHPMKNGWFGNSIISMRRSSGLIPEMTRPASSNCCLYAVLNS